MFWLAKSCHPSRPALPLARAECSQRESSHSKGKTFPRQRARNGAERLALRDVRRAGREFCEAAVEFRRRFRIIRK